MAENEEVLSPEELQLPNEVQARLRIGRTAERKAEALEAQVKSLELQGAIKDAGVPDHPARDVVFKDYDGPLDAESLRAYAEKFGLVAIQPVDSGPTAEEIAGQRQILNASGGSPAPSGDTDLAVAMRNAKSKEEVLALVAQAAGQPGFKNRDGLIGVLPEPY
jgi:hypothetical protein